MADQNPTPESDDIGKQLDALLAQVGDDESKAAEPTDSGDGHAADAANHADDELPGDMLPAEDLIGNDLAEQIQQMLDDAEKQQKALESGTAPAAAPAAQATPGPLAAAPAAQATPGPLAAAPSVMPAADATAPAAFAPPSVPSIAPPPTAPAPSPAPAESAGSHDAAEPADLAKIDQTMAEEADDAIAGDFDTVHDVLASEQAQAPAPAPIAAATPESAPVSNGFSATGADVGTELDAQSPKAVGAAAAAIGAATAVSAAAAAAPKPVTFAAPAPVASGAAKPSVAAPTSGPAPATPAEPRGPGLLTRLTQRVKSVRLPSTNPLRLARWTCATINAPLNVLAPTTRNTIGYVGLLTLFNASVLLMGKGATSLMGHEGPGTDTTQNAHLEPPSSEGGSSHGKAGSESHKGEAKKSESHKTEAKKSEPAKSEHGESKPKAAAKSEKSASKPAEKKSKPASSDASHGSGH